MVLFISAVIAFIVYTANISTLEDQIKDRLRNQAFHTMDKLDRMLYERQADTRVIAADPVIASGNSTAKQISKRLLEFQNNYKEYTSLSFFDLNRVRIADTKSLDTGKRHSLSGYWFELSEGKDVVCEISESESLKRQEFHFASVVRDRNGKPTGVVVARVALENIYDIAGKAVGIYNVKKDFRVELVDKNGLVIYSNPDNGLVFRDISPHWDIIKKEIASGLPNTAVRYTHHVKGGGEGILVFAREQGYKDFQGEGWTLIIEVPSEVVHAPANKLRNRLIIILLVISAVAFSFVLFLSRSVSMNIEKLGLAADAIGKGNLGVRTEIRSDDETGRLAAVFNKMATDLEEYRGKLLAHTNELENKVEERTVALKNRNAELQKSEERLRAIVEAIPLPVLISCSDNRILHYNSHFPLLFGISDRNLTGSEIPDFYFNPEDKETLMKEFSDNRYISGYEVRAKKQDGTMFWVIVSVQPLLYENKRAVLTVFYDITERKQMEQELKNHREHLEELVELRTAQLEESRERLRSVSLHLEAVREDERASVARDLHDELGQALTVLKMDASWLFTRLQDRQLSEKATGMIYTIDATIKTVKQMCSDLRPPILDYFGLAAAIEWQIKEFEQNTGISCHFRDGAGIKLGKEKAIMVFRIFQEALTNIARHAGATKTQISLTAENGKGTLTGRDNGKGITETQLSDAGALGLTGMKERAYLLGGNLTINGNQGTTVCLTFPVDKEV